MVAQPVGALAKGSTALPVLEESVLAELCGVLGSQKLASMLSRYLTDLRGRLKALETSVSAAELANVTHLLIGAAGQFGFKRFCRPCAEIEDEARQGGGLNRVADLMAVGASALAAGESSLYSRAPL